MTTKISEEEKRQKEAEGCELRQLGSREVFYCPVHDDMSKSASKDKEIGEMVDYQENV